MSLVIVQSVGDFDLVIACTTCLESSLMMIFYNLLQVASQTTNSAAVASTTFGFVLWMKSI